MYVVMGASGNVGGAALQTLQGGGHPVRALCRRPPQAEAGQGVDWLAVDALDAASLTQAFRGARCAFVMNPVGPDADNVFEQAARLSDLSRRHCARPAFHMPWSCRRKGRICQRGRA